MCDNSVTNLIDLSIEEDVEQQWQKLLQGSAACSPSKSEHEAKLGTSTNCLIKPPMLQSFDGSDNNPFDCVQQLANRPPDPFEMVEKEASIKARRSLMPAADVKLANLISLGEDIDSNDSNNTVEQTVASVASSTIYHSALEHHIDSESPPISMSMKSTPDTGSTAPGSADGSANSTDGSFSKLRKALENRKRLLKFSISNSTFNSPLSHHRITQQSDSGFGTIFSAAAHYSDHMIATESPVKLVDDDFMAEEPPKFPYSMEKDYDADLELLSIPMLKMLSTKTEDTAVIAHDKEIKTCVTPVDTMKASMPDLSTIREKLRNKRIEANNSKDVVNLIQSLKTLLCENSIVDGEKKDEANSLLEKLSNALTMHKADNETNKNEGDNVGMDILTPPPQPVVRQGTFDLELQEGKCKNAENEKQAASILATTSDTLPMTQSMPFMQSVQSLSPPREIPEAMFKSSATYDGEPLAKRENLILPIVDAVSPIPSLKTSPITNPDVNEIVEQLSKLLEHQLSQTHSDVSSGSDTTGARINPPSVINPTFIVVMPNAGVSQKSIEHGYYDDTAIPSNNDDVVMRRRSQSLSIHDKLKIVKLPTRAPTSETNSIHKTKPTALPVIEAKTYLDGNGHEGTNNTDFRTPMRNSARRNSFSSGTPYSPSKQGANSSYSRRLQGTTMSSRYSICGTRQDQQPSQPQGIVHPFPRANLDSFKPDLKRKVKPQTNASSIMKSKAPLKAVIPVKKVAPMITVNLPTLKCTSNSAQAHSNKASMDMSINVLSNAKRMSYTSTPMQLARGYGVADVATTVLDHTTGAPNACSTPALGNTPIRPGGMVLKNPRFLLTPTAMRQTTVNATELKKRTLPELAKGKSPTKSRTGLPMSAPAAKGRLSLKPQSNVTRTNNRSITRLSGRASISGTTVTTNKENKNP